MLDTEAGTWGGVHKAHRKQSFHTTDGGVFGRDYTLTLDLPAMGSYLLRLYPGSPEPGRRPPERQQGAGAKAQGGKGRKDRRGSFR